MNKTDNNAIWVGNTDHKQRKQHDEVKHIVNHVALADRGKFSLSIDVRPLPQPECAIVTSIKNENYYNNAPLDLLFSSGWIS